MRQARLRGEGQSYYHCISRVVDRRYIFQDEEKELFVGIDLIPQVGHFKTKVLPGLCFG